MSQHARLITEYLDAFMLSDHGRILACLADDVEWVLPGVYHRRGKAEFDAEIENGAFIGSPVISITRLVESGDIVLAEGTVRATRREGQAIHLVFCDVFEMRRGLIRKLTSYLMEIPA